MEYYFDRDDRLDRQKYAEFLKTLLLNCDQYRREDSEGAYVIALDSPWGTGKTRFVKMLRNYLEDRTSEAEKNRTDGKEDESLPPGNSAEFNVIYYNAWDTDFCENALEPLLCTIVNSDVFAKIKEDSKGKKIWDCFVRFAKGALECSCDMPPTIALYGFIVKTVFAGVKTAIQKPETPFRNYEKQKKLYRDFADQFGEIIRATGKKLVIIIDELDRCRPTFAIQTLELAKHLFAVKGLIFISALDIEQLSHSAEIIYGQKMDTAGYLCRFFDYIGKIETPDRLRFIGMLISKIDYKEVILNSINLADDDGSSFDSFAKFVEKIACCASLSLRDLNVLFATFNMLLNSYLYNYESLDALKLYFFLIFLKYKHAKLLKEILSEIAIPNIETYLNSIHGLYLEPKILNGLVFINKKELLSEIGYTAYPLNLAGKAILDSFGMFHESEQLKKGGRKTIRKYNIPKPIIIEVIRKLETSKGKILFDFILFTDDLLKWEKLRTLTAAQYYSTQLEMFNFVIPPLQTPVKISRQSTPKRRSRASYR